MVSKKKQDIWTRVILFFFISVILIYALQVFIDPLAIQWELSQQWIFNLKIMVNGVIGIGLAYLFLAFDEKNLSHIGLTIRPDSPYLFLIGLPVALLGLLFTFGLELFGGVATLGDVLRWDVAIITAVFTLFGAGIGEEVIYRGYLQATLEESYPFWEAVTATAIMFGGIHFFMASGQGVDHQLVWGISSVFIGYAFGYAYHKTKNNLVFGIGIHFFWNMTYFLWDTTFTYNPIDKAIVEIVAALLGAAVIMTVIALAYNFGVFEKLGVSGTDEAV